MSPIFTWLLLTLLCSLQHVSLVSAVPSVSLSVSSSDGSYSVTVDGEVWLSSGSSFFRVEGRLLSGHDGSLRLLNVSAQQPGEDSVGRYSQTSIRWGSGDAAVADFAVETSIKAYHALATQSGPYSSSPLAAPPASNVRAIVFTQTYLSGASGTNTTRQSVISGFPTFSLSSISSSSPRLGWYQWAAQFFWTSRRAAVWDAAADIYGGVETGPIALYSSNASTVVMLAPFTRFMDASMAVTDDGSGGRQISYGPLGNLLRVPAGWSMATMLYFDDVGVAETVMRWGDVMTAAYGKSRAVSAADLVNSWLGYNTDRGATYYVNNATNSTYEQTMYAVKAYADSLRIPYHYWLTDSRWYQEGKDGGVSTWTPLPRFFSEGFPTVTRNLGWKLVAHNRYFSSQTPYAKQNGGQYEFVVQGNSSLPVDARFWSDLFAQRSDWGLTMLFMDWLYTVSDGIDAVNEVIGLGELWLRQMATAASTHSVTIQYCMALARHLFASLQHPAVTQIRVSNDGMPGDVFQQWQIGESGILAFALGVIPFKDNYWTTSVQCVNPYYGKNCTEPNVLLESAVASFSTGAVAPGDGIGMSNVSIILRSITTEGRILKPSRPMASVDLWYAAQAFTAGGVQWQLQSTYTQLQRFRWHYVLAVNNEQRLGITAESIHMDDRAVSHVAWDAIAGVADYQSLRSFESGDAFSLTPSSLPDFHILHFAPVLPCGIALLGERDKWVRISEQRIASIDLSTDRLSLELRGEPGEQVSMDYARTGHLAAVLTASCVMDMDGQALLSITAAGTASCTARHFDRETWSSEGRQPALE